MNQDQIEARWKQFTGSARDRWDRLSRDDIGALAGSSRPAGKTQKTVRNRAGEPERQADN